jgi:hypothetical protein
MPDPLHNQPSVPEKWVLDGKNWTVIDRQAGVQFFKDDFNTGSFPISRPAQYRWLCASDSPI